MLFHNIFISLLSSHSLSSHSFEMCLYYQELQMDQQAKKHLQEEFDASLEEKDQLINVLQTQVR